MVTFLLSCVAAGGIHNFYDSYDSCDVAQLLLKCPYHSGLSRSMLDLVSTMKHTWSSVLSVAAFLQERESERDY